MAFRNLGVDVKLERFSSNELESPKIDDCPEDEIRYVITRSGKKEPLNPDMITRRVRSLINKKPKIHHVDPYEVMQMTTPHIQKGMTTHEIDSLAAHYASELGISNPKYLILAARIAIDNHRKYTPGSFVDKIRIAYHNKDSTGALYPLIAEDFMKYVEEHQDYIESMIDYNRDFLLDYTGFDVFLKSYSLKINGHPIERPQDMFMRVAVDINMNTCENQDEELENIKQTYDALSMLKYTQASPTYFNAATPHRQYASCFLLGTDDSCKGIMKTAAHLAEISKWAGGIGVHINCLRSFGAPIRSTGGQSNGLIKWLQIYNSVLRGFDQGGKRPGSGAFYLMPHHPDILKFIEAGRYDGMLEDRARDLFYALWIPDIFMERVANKGMWSMFDPFKTVDLSNYSGDDYRAKYLELEEKKLYEWQIPARTLWNAMIETNKERGRLYICFSDKANKSFMQKNLGTLKSFNLCSEVGLYSSADEYGVCILSSISLPAFVFDSYSEEELKLSEDKRRKLNREFPLNPQFNFTSLIETVKIITRNLNYITDKTFQPVEETKRGTLRNRPIGIGVQGLDGCYTKMRYAYSSNEAAELNKKIFETIYYAALCKSCDMARQDYLKYKNICKEKGKVEIKTYVAEHYDDVTVTYTNPDEIPKTIGAYPSMLWNGGAPISKGTFHWELCGLSKDKLSGMYDWESLREKIKIFGVKNSLLTACMPTATTSMLLGNNESIEPCTNNMYIRRRKKEQYLMLKKYLFHDLFEMGVWSDEFKNYLMENNGSIQKIDDLPDDFKELYKTAWEIDPTILIDQAADRQPFVDQAQSLNIWSEKLNEKKFTEWMFRAWSKGVKTGKYYSHTRPAADPQKFTIMKASKKLTLSITPLNYGKAVVEELHEYCDSCG